MSRLGKINGLARTSTRMTIGISVLICIGASGCKPKKQSEVDRIRQEQGSGDLSELPQRFATIRLQILRVARDAYRKGDTKKSADCLSWFYESADISETSTILKAAQILYKLAPITGNDAFLMPSEIESLKHLKDLATGVTAVPAASLTIAAAGFSGYLGGYLVPALRGMEKQVAHLVELYQEQNDIAIDWEDPDLVAWKAEPGGRPVFDFMVAMKKSNSVATITHYINDQVLGYFDKNRSGLDSILRKIDGSTYSKIPTNGFIYKEIDSSKFADWAFRHSDDLWLLIYGDRKVPENWTFKTQVEVEL